MINLAGITGWLSSNIIPLAIIMVALIIIFGAKKGKLADGLSMTMVLILGLILFFGALTFVRFGETISQTVFVP